ncbi:MAG: PKD repeat protein [Crocinitomicaceae bacterium]|jgi:PKD repeat protein
MIKYTLVLFSLFATISASAQKDVSNQEDLIIKTQKYLEKNHQSLGLELNDVKSWVVTDNYTSSSTGVRHLHIAQTINGIRIQNGVANITMDAKDSVLFVSNRLIANIEAKSRGVYLPTINAFTAITKAAEHIGIKGESGIELSAKETNEFQFDKGSLSKEDITVQLNFWDAGEEVRLVWIVSIYELTGEHWWQIFIDAENGEELNRLDWVKSCDFGAKEPLIERTSPYVSPMMPIPPPGTDQYNVFALPIESPNHGAISLEVGPFNSTASPFGWHDDNGIAGEEYTITRGNNVYAYEDVNDIDAPGYSPDGGIGLDFNFALNLSQNPSNYQDPALTNLFYTCNRAHDIFHQNGFDEASGNFQENNYGNGGFESDYVYAEAQDGGGTNNANFATPSDGNNPRMQMYLWSYTGSTISNYLDVNSPGIIAGTYSAADAVFGPGLPATPITADVVLITDNTAPINDGCEIITNSGAISGKIVLIDRGNCSFVNKIVEAQNAGAIAVIIANNVAGVPFQMGGTSNFITIPSIMISQADGNSIKAQLSGGTVVNATINNGGGIGYPKDGDLDNGIILHEYGHGVSTRLTGGSSNSGCLDNLEQMGEGWSDFFACMLTMDMGASNPVNRPIGTYVTGQPINGNGIRPTPYDTSFTINNFTYASVADVAYISEPHGVGFIWATMLWDLNWAFIDQYGFDSNIDSGTGGNNMVLQLVIEGLKLQPCSPGFVDGRDAILLADQIQNGGANECLIWKTFAKRGLGYSASQGSSLSRTDQSEAFDVPLACAIPVIAPVANFDANVYVSCSGEIQFEDLSTDIPQDWLWNFGDGSTDTVQNPMHIYGATGIYNVSLTVSNTIGNDTQTISSFIEVIIPDSPIGLDGFGCVTDSILLTASASDLIHWTDLSGNLLSTGTDFYAAAAASSSSYYAVNVIEYPHYSIGAMDTTIGTGGNHNTGFIGAINFDASAAFTIYSAWVFSGAVGVRTVSLWDNYNSTGVPIEVIDIDIPFTGAGRIDLGFDVPGQGQYSLGLSDANLYRNTTGASYPYDVTGMMSIVSSSSTTSPSDYYYYFYDLDIGIKSCTSDSLLVTANVLIPDFTWSSALLNAYFIDASTGASSWEWNFGDGNTSTAQSPTHLYAQNGVYTVTLTVNGECIIQYNVSIGGIGIDLITKDDFILSLFPNPANDETTLTFNKPLTANSTIRIFSIEGRLIDEIKIGVGATELKISLNDMAPQVYYLVFDHVNGQKRKKLVVQK